ncbi:MULTISPECIES: rod shape-determining protein MreC [Thiomicrorhabdus]|uniref:rod shape-determining protein MreC n=1 Tax=Thiomicrorhabdus TaxID=2039723 RepID=UPI0029C64B78|nr:MULTISPECIES: rod shape-determining protein MreC [Thiomicrorhabdus]
MVAFILAVTVMAADHYGHIMGSVRGALLTALNPIERIATYPQHLYQSMASEYSTRNKLLLENQQLNTELLLLKAKQQQLANLQMEVHRLEALLGTTGKMNDQSVQIANISFYSNNPLAQFVTLNKGQKDGVENQQTVIDANGIMGQIVQTTPSSSRALLITDPDHQIPVRIQRTAQRGILTGKGHDLMQLNFIPYNSEVKVGDILESSGLGGVFPQGYPVARVSKVEARRENPYLTISALPIAQLHQTHKVLILGKPEKEEEENTAASNESQNQQPIQEVQQPAKVNQPKEQDESND